LTDAENERVYGAAANPLGHGHNYVVEVAIEGEPDPVTGMILDLKRLREILEEKVLIWCQRSKTSPSISGTASTPVFPGAPGSIQ
jgi:hypothetical protein